MAVRPWPAPVSVSDVAAAGDWAGDWLLQLGPEETPATGLRPYHISSPLTSICANVEILPLHHPSRTYLFIYLIFICIFTPSHCTAHILGTKVS